MEGPDPFESVDETVLLTALAGHLTSTHKLLGTFLVAQMVKNPPAVQETRGLSLGGEGTLKKGMVTHSSILAWRMPWTEEPGGLQSLGWQRVRHD